ncbi:MAG TPA: electron transport complex subunit RsxE [Acholeplasmataceae bacterium]|jgi:electron transport complex protein RnfE|nr:electron transport complex subunit RsxE [Acholeplasmataceae bacterium]HPX71772.1 electron transport complex subunit RsxE [Acholeplasmataceae bacterium]HQC31057.1 electron transport complex subunit RsxE [Acholeplasmataceae bacterium]
MAKEKKVKETKPLNPDSLGAVFSKGLIKENPIFISLLGLCPALAVTTSFEGAFGMALLVIIILTITNIIISAIRNFIPDEIRIPVYIVVIATIVTVIQMLVQAFVPALYSTLGVFIALITVNCIILGRAEAFASKNGVVKSIFDGLGMGLGFGLAIMLVGFIREFFGTGTIIIGKVFTFIPEFSLIPYAEDSNVPRYFIGVLTTAPGAFIVMGLLLALLVFIQDKRGAKK